MTQFTQAERITALEVQLANLTTLMNTHVTQQQKMAEDITDLLGLRNKGIGAFWLAASLTGTGLISLVVAIIGWFKGGPPPHVG